MVNLNNFHKVPFTVDNVIFGFDNGLLRVLLIKRGEEPFINKWALPGYFVQEQENLDTAAKRVLQQLTSLKNVFLEQVTTYGDPNRHPFGKVITVAYYSLIKIEQKKITPTSIARKAKWVKIEDINKDLAFDHNQIFTDAFNKLKWNVRFRPVGFELLPPKFTLTELQQVYEAILEKELDKRNFRKKILALDLLVDLNEMQEGVAHRPAKLFKFDEEKYKKLRKEGYIFDLTESNKKVTNKTKL